MNLYLITFADGSQLEEVGVNEQDVRDFLKRSYSDRVISTITQI